MRIHDNLHNLSGYRQGAADAHYQGSMDRLSRSETLDQYSNILDSLFRYERIATRRQPPNRFVHTGTSSHTRPLS
jgi:hypothetical protein